MTLMARIVVLCLVLLAAPAAAASNGMSIDCASSKEPFAPAICGSRYLRSLDAHMTRLYNELTDNRTGAQLQEVKAAQARWWKRRAVCEPSEDPQSCAEKYLLEQIALLRHFRDVPVLEHPSPVSDADYDRMFLSWDAEIAAIMKKIKPVSVIPALREQISSFIDTQDRDILDLEAVIRAAMLRLLEGNYPRALLVFNELDKKPVMQDATINQRARILLLRSLAEKRANGASLTSEYYWIEYCQLGLPCNRDILDTDNPAIENVLALGSSPKYRRVILSASLLPQVKSDAAAARAQIEAEEEAARHAAERERQRQMDEILAASRAADAAKRAAKEEEARQLRHTFRYQAALIGRSILESVTFIWLFFPIWSYPVAAVIGLLVHRHLTLRIALGLASFAALGCYALYTSFLQSTLPASPTAFLSTVWRTWAAYNPDIASGRLALNLVLTYVLLLVLAYILTLILVGRDVRAAEAYRLRGFVPEWVRGWRYAFSQRWAERSEMKRQLRHARHEAKITALQVRAQQPQQLAYAYPPPSGAGGAVRSFFDFSRATVSLVKWGIIAGSIFVVVRFGEGIIDKLSSLIEKTMTLIERLPAFLK